MKRLVPIFTNPKNQSNKTTANLGLPQVGLKHKY